MTTVAVPPARVATTGRPMASDSIATTGVPSFTDVSSEASNSRVPLADSASGSRRSGSVLGDAEVARERFRRTAELAVADEHEHRVDALIQDSCAGCE